jgi:hypothetical protein
MVRAQLGGRWNWESIFLFSLLLSSSFPFVSHQLHLRLSQLSPEHNGSVSDGIGLWLTNSFQPRQSQWLDSRERPIPNDVRTFRIPTALPVEPQRTTLPASPPNTLPPHNLPDSAIATQLKLPNQSNCEEFNFPEGVDDFKSSLLDYGRSIIDSAMNEDADPQTLESDIITAKEKVITQFTAVYQHLEELSDSLYSKDGEAAKLRTEISELERAKAAMEEEKSDVIQAMDVDYAMMKNTAEDHCAEKERYQKMWEEAEKGRQEAEDELAGIKQDNKRKRDRLEKMWGNVEREVKQ